MKLRIKAILLLSASDAQMMRDIITRDVHRDDPQEARFVERFCRAQNQIKSIKTIAKEGKNGG